MSRKARTTIVQIKKLNKQDNIEEISQGLKPFLENDEHDSVLDGDRLLQRLLNPIENGRKALRSGFECLEKCIQIE